MDGSGAFLGLLNSPPWLITLLASGVGNGIREVAAFIPILGFLYLFISVLEESGYMARATFAMDRFMRVLGLPGKAFVPMMLGFGCNVPAMLATRTLERPRDRLLSIVFESIHDLRRSLGGIYPVCRRLFSRITAGWWCLYCI